MCKLQMACHVVWRMFTRGVQKVRRLTQLTTRYLHHILSLCNVVSCNCNALGPAFLQSSQFVVEELWFLVFQPIICRADNVFIVSKSASFHEFFQFRKQIEVTWGQVWRIRWVTDSSKPAFRIAASASDGVCAGALSWWNSTPRCNFLRLFSLSASWTCPIRSA